MSTPPLATVLRLLRLEGQEFNELVPGKPIEDVNGDLIAMELSYHQRTTFDTIGLTPLQWQELGDEAATQLSPIRYVIAERAAENLRGHEDRARAFLRQLIAQQDHDQEVIQ